MRRDRCPSRIAHESGAVLRCMDVPGHDGNHVTTTEQWSDGHLDELPPDDGHGSPEEAV